MTPEEAVEQVRALSERCKQDRRAALSWVDDVAFPVSLVWLPARAAGEADLVRSLVSPRLRRRIDALTQSLGPPGARRAAYAVCDRLALRVACGEALKSPNLTGLHLAHTPLGQPVVRWRGEIAERARDRGIRRRDLNISYTHDHDSHLTLATCAPGIKGVGIDVVHLDRLRGERKGRPYIEKFARHFMSSDELEIFLADGRMDDDERFRIRVAAHFSLMEAASKALGTGLVIGLGMGRSTSLPKQSIGVRRLRPDVEFMLRQEATARIRHLRASHLTGHWGADGEYLVSAAILE